jgi:hypothetical protein
MLLSAEAMELISAFDASASTREQVQAMAACRFNVVVTSFIF